MNMRPFPLIVSITTVLAPCFTTGVASAQQQVVVAVPQPQLDGARFRGGVALEGGAFVAPGAVTLGAIGVQGQLGVQLTHNWGVYALPRLDVVFGHAGGVALGAGAVADYTFDDLPISVGVGPEVGVIGAFGASADTSGTGASSAAVIGGAFYGATLHFAWHPILVRGDNGIRRKALSIGVDVHMLGGTYAGGSESVSAGGTAASGSAAVGHFALSPVATIGYTAF